ncbi:MAG TPA: hypothetical protein VJX66_32015 [Amycolatopsis sp.]|nr:hypothetical protein [Amycolatopsis sp.]
MASKTYRVTSALVQALADTVTGRSLVYVYQGGTVPDGQTQEWIDHHLSIDAIEEFDAGSDVAPDIKPVAAKAKSD